MHELWSGANRTPTWPKLAAFKTGGCWSGSIETISSSAARHLSILTVMSNLTPMLNAMEQGVREELASLKKSLGYYESTLTLMLETNTGEHEDPLLPQEIQQFRDYISTLREGIQRLESIQRVQN